MPKFEDENLLVGFDSSDDASVYKLKDDIAMNYTQSGLLLSGQFLGMMLTAVFGGPLIERFGKRRFYTT